MGVRVCLSCLSNRGSSKARLLMHQARRSWSSIRERAALQDVVLNLLSAKVNDPSVPDRSVVDIGLVQRLVVDKEAGKISLRLEYPTAGYPDRFKVADAIKKTLLGDAALPWVREVDVELGGSRPQSSVAALGSGLANVSHVVAVSSCKGGVGKSTVAVNLALSLSALGNRVGLLDLDIYGPSLPTLLPATDPALRPSPRNPKFVLPIEEQGIKCLSFGYVNSQAGVPGAGGQEAAVLRGPMASKVVSQLLLTTEWGELDYLVLDMPPGTGDVQLSVGQTVSLSGAVVVTTPQELAVVDVLKGLRMWQVMKVPTLAVVENMSYFTCGKCDEKHHIFGHGASQRILAAFPSIPRSHLFELPLSPAVSAANDTHRPITIAQPHAPETQVYSSLAAHVCREIFKERFRAASVPQLSYDRTANMLVLRLFERDSARQLLLPPLDVRASDPRTGEAAPNAHDVPPHVRPEKLDFKGTYGVSIVWSDGHYGTIYTYDALERIAARVAASKAATQ